MRRCKLLLVCLCAIAYTNASSSDAQTQQAEASLAIDPITLPTMEPPARTLSKSGERGSYPGPRANFSNIKGRVVKRMRATSAFVQRQAANTGTFNGWLIMLAALGLIVLQLRHKHKSLPQRRITPYG
ncbi:MAG: hypothetical protein WA803_21135 [Steroidobacteraceae bacterium]